MKHATGDGLEIRGRKLGLPAHEKPSFRLQPSALTGSRTDTGLQDVYGLTYCPGVPEASRPSRFQPPAICRCLDEPVSQRGMAGRQSNICQRTGTGPLNTSVKGESDAALKVGIVAPDESGQHHRHGRGVCPAQRMCSAGQRLYQVAGEPPAEL
jgi:hypothetical protein